MIRYFNCNVNVPQEHVIFFRAESRKMVITFAFLFSLSSLSLFGYDKKNT